MSLLEINLRITRLGQQESRHFPTVGVSHIQASAQASIHWQQPWLSPHSHTLFWHDPLDFNQIKYYKIYSLNVKRILIAKAYSEKESHKNYEK